MTTWLQELLRAHPGDCVLLRPRSWLPPRKLSIGSFKLGAVTRTLLAGVDRRPACRDAADELKQCLFLLFLFAIGFRTGPAVLPRPAQRRAGTRGSGCDRCRGRTGRRPTWCRGVFGYDPGTAAGLVAGSLTESAAIGTAMDTIPVWHLRPRQSACEGEQHSGRLRRHLSGRHDGRRMGPAQLAPKLMRVDLAEECRKLEEEMRGGQPTNQARPDFELRAYAVDPECPLDRPADRRAGILDAGREDFSRARPQWRPDPRAAMRLTLRAGDIVAVSGRRDLLVEALRESGIGLREVDDQELLDLPGDIVDVVVTSGAVDGRALSELGAPRGCAWGLPQANHPRGRALGQLPATIVHRGDVYHRRDGGQCGARRRAHRCCRSRDRRDGHAGRRHRHRGRGAGRPSGAALRECRDWPQPARGRPSWRIGLRLAALGQAGLVRARSRTHALGVRIHRADGFVAVVGLNAGPDFVRGLKTSGLGLVVAGALTISIASWSAWWLAAGYSRCIRACCWACVPGRAPQRRLWPQVQETAKSTVPSLGYGVAYAVGNVLLAIGAQSSSPCLRNRRAASDVTGACRTIARGCLVGTFRHLLPRATHRRSRKRPPLPPAARPGAPHRNGRLRGLCRR